MIISDIIPLDPAHSRLIGVTIPYLCCSKKVDFLLNTSRTFLLYIVCIVIIHFFYVFVQIPAAPTSSSSHQGLITASRLSMKDYIGLENSEKSILKAMADFSFYSAFGKMDEAFRAIKLIKR